MTGHREVILAGSGGQGVVLAAILLAEAAILDGRNVVQTQSYGIASRGGLSSAEVIIDSDEIVFQQVRVPDCVLVLTEEAARKYEGWAAKGATVLYDSTLVAERQGANLHGHPFTRVATDLGQSGSVNVLALGTLVRHTGVVSGESLQAAVRQRFRGAAARLNADLLAAGVGLAEGRLPSRLGAAA